jgi:hypothetical protein
MQLLRQLAAPLVRKRGDRALLYCKEGGSLGRGVELLLYCMLMRVNRRPKCY